MPDPLEIHTITTAAIDRKGKCGCELCQPETAADRLIDSQSRRLTEMRVAIHCLKAELAKRDETIAKLNEQDHRRCSKILEQTRTIAELRSQLARIEEAAEDVIAFRYKACLSLDTAIYKLWLAKSGTPSVYPKAVPTAEVLAHTSPSITEGLEALRKAGGNAWDQVADVGEYLGRDDQA